MALGKWTFRPTAASSLLALLFAGITVALGEWQSGRADEKLALQAQWQARTREPAIRLGDTLIKNEEMAFRRVEITGDFVPERTLFIDNRVYRKQAGFHVVALFKVEGRQNHVLVNRGWVAAGSNRLVLPDIVIPSGKQRINGIAMPPARGIYELAPESSVGKIRQHLVIDRVAAEFSVELPNFVILETGTDGALVRDWPEPNAGVNTHLGYTLQWRALAVAIFLAWIYFGLRRKNATG